MRQATSLLHRSMSTKNERTDMAREKLSVGSVGWAYLALVKAHGSYYIQPRRCRTAWALVALALCAIAGAGCDRLKESPAVTGPDLRGEWQSGGSVYRLTTDGTKVRAVFETVSPDGQALGFKSGDLSFVGTRNGPFIQGEQVIRYPANIPCHRETGRRVPFMAMI